ncbi:Uncharacterized protein dnl_62890 [Desulfonema limicola]|uniref:Uncharacterized protein n=1 Tax=Desulfonema limicola TaxID=45656 RepID=A0A975BEE8_9BACT|nr:hypothetical protein [Desulfonema limicola]QTA83867.1 Uncharacterized protein dnl_62890 [Desulfonema limicola]
MKALQHSLPFLPEEIQIISDKIGVVRNDSDIVFYNASGPIYMCKVDDKEGLRIAQGMFVDLKLARPKQIASALGVNASTVQRNKKKYQDGGVKAFAKAAVPERTPYKLDDEKCKEIQENIDKNLSIRSAAEEAGLSEGTIRNGLKRGDLKKENSENKPKSTSERSSQDQESESGIAVKRHSERFFARKGLLEEAKPRFEASEGVKYGGVLIALPVILSQGLLDIGKQVYKKLSNGFFGLQTIFLTLIFMSLLRIKTPEQLTRHSPGELGIVLGLDRAPEVKTLRRKIEELGNQGNAREFADLLARHWADENPDVLGFLYIDGHVRPYHGKNKLPKTHVAQKRLCMPATTDFWVNGTDAQPLFFVTTEANDTLLSTIENEILPEIKQLVEGDKRVTLVFDRAGWSPKTFKKWYDMGFDVMTYRKGNYEPWPEECFQEFEIKICNKKVKYNLGQRSVNMGLKNEDFWMREVRRLCDNGHQTSIITTKQDIDEIFIAVRMFSRWKQENFFRYMGIEFDFNHLCTYDVEPADLERLVPNPAIKEKKKELEKIKKEYEKNLKKLSDAVIQNNDVNQNAKLMQTIRDLDIRCAELVEVISDMPEKAAVKETMDEDKIVKLETERKILTDLIKMTAYRAETSLFDLLVPPVLARNEEEGRSFLKAVFQTPADIIPDEENKCLIVQFHTMANQRSNSALKALCEIINHEECLYPGTDLRLVFNPPELQTKLRPCQEV